jgi:hypothetical protein
LGGFNGTFEFVVCQSLLLFVPIPPADIDEDSLVKIKPDRWPKPAVRQPRRNAIAQPQSYRVPHRSNPSLSTIFSMDQFCSPDQPHPA